MNLIERTVCPGGATCEHECEDKPDKFSPKPTPHQVFQQSESSYLAVDFDDSSAKFNSDRVRLIL